MKAKVWHGRDDVFSRLYINGAGRDIKAFIEIPVEDHDGLDVDAGAIDYLYQGCVLKVFSSANQDRKWLGNRAKQVKHGYMLALAEIDKETSGALFGSLGADVCEDWRDVGL
jgi:hypothetical protein|tara:strand:+ start:651 stop:986 length:336 start_codon:yes stop_codon:yes gene_type:complete